MKKIIIFFFTTLTLFALAPLTVINGETPRATIFEDIALQQGVSIDKARLPSKNPQDIVAKVIRIFLSLLGTIFVVLIIYAGYLLMTAQGEEEQVTKAKDLIRNAIIGLIIVLAAYTITKFVIEKGASSTGLLLR